MNNRYLNRTLKDIDNNPIFTEPLSEKPFLDALHDLCWHINAKYVSHSDKESRQTENTMQEFSETELFNIL